MPSSFTEILNSESFSTPSIHTCPLISLYFIPFSMRFNIICLNLSKLPLSFIDAETSLNMDTPFSSRIGFRTSVILSTTSFTFISSSTFASVFSTSDRTSISFISLFSLSVSSAIIFINLFLVSSSSTAPDCNVSINPEIDVKGVFNSWLAFATNSDLIF